MMHADDFSLKRKGTRLMETECGTPAFDNIDDLLASRIVNRSRSNTDRTDMESRDEESPSAPREPLKPPEVQHRKWSARTLFIVAAAVAVLLIVKYLIRHLSRR